MYYCAFALLYQWCIMNYNYKHVLHCLVMVSLKLNHTQLLVFSVFCPV